MSDHVQPEASSAPQKDVLIPHDHDGIQEYDNPAPMWLQAILWGTILFSLVYIPYYVAAYVLDFDSPQIQVAKEMKAVEAQRAAEAKNKPAVPEMTQEALLALVKDPAVVAKGKQQFTTSCASCHLANGQGLIGPNLTDDYWIHGAKLTDIRRTIVQGVPAKGMLTWGPLLKPDAIDALVAYIATLHGTNPANPKPPQGDQVPWPN